MKLKRYKNFMNENTRTTYDYGCAMLSIESPELKEISGFIDKNDLHEYGIENSHHVTLLYGIHSDEVSDDIVFDICTQFTYPKIRLHNLSLFKNDKFDVLKLEVDCDVLHKVNKELTKLPHTTQYPNYVPHVTIAYLKPGLGEKYLSLDFTECYAKPIEIEYSHPDGSVTKMKL
jgi:2'-5' RNA ligase